MDNILRERWLRWLGHVFPYGPPMHTAASTVLVGTRIQERTRSTKNEPAECSQQRPTKDGVYLGGSKGGSSWQTRMASECGPMCPVGYGMNQGQGQLLLRHLWLKLFMFWALRLFGNWVILTYFTVAGGKIRAVIIQQNSCAIVSISSGCVTVCHAWTTANSHRPQYWCDSGISVLNSV